MRIREPRAAGSIARLCTLSAVVAAALAALAAAPSVVGAQELALTHANVIDVVDGSILADVTVLVEGGRITTIESGAVTIPPRYDVVDVKGMFVSPGMMDAHVHIGSIEQASRALQYGVTTARSMGTANFADVGLRELKARGYIDVPEILAAGYHVRPRPAEGFFLNHPELADLRESEVRGAEAIETMVSTLLSHDVDFIKTNATERAGLPQTDPRKQFYSEDEMSVMVRTAGARGVSVAAHAHGDAGGRAAVLAGVRSIEHGTFLQPATLQLMAERGTFLVPTVAIVRDLTIPGGDYDIPALAIRGRYMLPRIRETAATAHELGVKLVAATDTGYGPGGTVRLSHELEEFVGLGLTNLEALQAATINAAELFGIDDRTGRIDIGMEGDLIITERNPLVEIQALQDVLMVINDGKVVVTRGDWWPERERPIS